MSVIAYSSNNTLVIGEVSHYHFYQPMNHTSHQRPTQKYQRKKTIIPSVPRQHGKAPANSPLSFIRQEKLPQTNTDKSLTQPSIHLVSSPSITSTRTIEPPSPIKQRPPLSTHSTTDLLKNLPLFPKKQQLGFGRRPRKVSFDENVMVICTRFNGDDDDDDDNDDNGGGGNALDNNPPNLGNTQNNFDAFAPTTYQGRRHSTGDYFTDAQRQRTHWLTLVKSLKRWKYALPTSPP